MGQGSEKGVVILQLVTLILPSKGMIAGKSHWDLIEVSTRRSISEFCCWTLLVTMIGSQRLTLEAYNNMPRQKFEGRFQMLTAQLPNPSLQCLKASNRGITWRSSIWRSSVFPRQRPLKSFYKPSRRLRRYCVVLVGTRGFLRSAIGIRPVMILQADSVHGVSVCHSTPQFQNLQPHNLDQISSWYEVGVFFLCPPVSWDSSPYHPGTSHLDLHVTGHPCGISSFKFAEIQGGGTPWKKGLRICRKEGSRKQLFLSFSFAFHLFFPHLRILR